MGFRTCKMILRGVGGRAEVVEVVRALGGPSSGELTTEAQGTKLETFDLGGGTRIVHAVDALANCEHVQVFVTAREATADVIGALERGLALWSFQDLLALYDRAESEEDQDKAVRWLGCGAPAAYDEDFFSRISAALRSSSVAVRDGALSAVAFYAMRRFLPQLRDFAANEPVEDLRETAEIIVRIIEQRIPERSASAE